jgi:ubiquinone biosynthesis protein UbiJ
MGVARSANVGTANGDADLMRRVRALIDETEKRQNRELALRIGEVLRDVNAQRQADLVRIDRSLGLVQNDLGVEVLKQRQSLNYLMRVNQR